MGLNFSFDVARCALDAGLIPKFINRKHGREAIDFPHSSLAPILGETYGIYSHGEIGRKIMILHSMKIL